MSFLKSGFKWLILLVSFLSSWSAFASATSDVYLSFQERVLTGYALLAYKASPGVQAAIQARAIQYVTKISQQQITTVNVANFNEFLKNFRGEWPNSGDLALDIQHIESLPIKGLVTYKASSPRIQHQIDLYLDNHLKYFKNLAVLPESEIDLDHPAQFKKMFDQEAEKRFAEFNTIGTKIANSAFNAIPDPLDRIRLRILFDQYYTLLSLDAKKTIISEMLGQKMDLSDQDKFGIMVNNSGPQLQKLLQVIIRQNGIPDEVKENFKSLEDSAKAVPWWRVQQILQAEKDNFDFVYFGRKPLGIGTMAQVHRAKMMINGEREDVVVRFLKPDIEERIEDDHKILSQVAAKIDNDPEYRRLNGPLMSPLMGEISATVKAELDMKATMDRQTLAKAAYDREVLLKTRDFKGDLQFYVPKIFGGEKKSQLMVQQMVIGRSLDKEARFYADLAPDLKKAIIEEVAKLWINEVFFGSGFYHSDLHQGNFLVKVAEPKTQVALLDFGMGGTIDKKTQQNLLLLGVALQTKKPEVITEAYWGLSDEPKNQLSRQQFLAKVEQHVKDLAKQNKPSDMFEWTGWASNEGLGLPYDFINLNRGILIITKSLEDAGSDLTFTSIAQSLALKNPGKVLTALKTSSTLKWIDVVKLGWSQQQPPTRTAAPAKSEAKIASPALAGLRCELVFAP